MASRKNHNGKGAPFYALPARRKSSAEIIREAKAEIHAMSSRRPSTPFVKNSQKNNSRPSSSASQISFSPEPPLSRPLSGVRLKPLHSENSASRESVVSLHLEPTVVKTTLTERKMKCKFTTQSSSPFVSSSSDVLQGSSDVETRCSSTMSSRTRSVKSQHNEIRSDVRSRKSEPHEKRLEKCSMIQNFHLEKLHLVFCLHLDGSVIGVEYSSSSNSESDEETRKIRKFSEDVSRFFPLLEKLIRAGKGKNESHGVDLVAKLYRLLEESNMFQCSFQGRLNLLKLVFKLLDYSFPVLSLHVSKLVLEMRISDKNLANICKLLYKLCQEEKNIIEFLSCGILGPFFDCLQTVSPNENADALKYSASLLCVLAANDLLLEVLGVFKCHDILLHYLSEINNMDSEKNIEFSSIVIKVITALRYLIEDKAIYESVVTVSTVEHLFHALAVYQGDAEVVITVLRLLRCTMRRLQSCSLVLQMLIDDKLVETEEGCFIVVSCKAGCSVLTELLKSYKSQQFVSVQISFIIGNLICYDDDLALDFYSSEGFLDILISLLDDFIHHQVEKAKQTSSFSTNLVYSAGDSVSDKDMSELMLKIIRIFANMCVNDDVGQKLAENGKFLITLLKLIESYRVFESEAEDILEPLTSILVTVNNITYFIKENSEVAFLCIKIAEAVIPLLSSTFHVSIRIEACSIVQNITRISDVRSFILKGKLMPAFVSLLDEYDHDIAVGGYAIIMNLLLDKQAREPFYKEQGVTKLLHKLHLCLCRDWKTAALLCQILWNYCTAEENSNKPLTHLEIQHLIKVLHYATGPNVMLKTDDEHDKKIWESEFCIVGKKLLNLLQSFT